MLLQISLGCRYSDLFSFSPDMFSKDDILTYYPTKTRGKGLRNKITSCRLNQISKQILQEYDYDTRKLSISNQKFNDGIEDLCKELHREHPEHFTRNLYKS